MLLALSGAVACGKLGTNLDQVVALEVSLPDSGNVEIGDTIIPHAQALNGRGDSVAAALMWASFNPDTLQILDPATGAALGRAFGTARVQARVGNLRSNPLLILVETAADSGRAASAARSTVTVSAPDSLSDSLVVRLFATPTQSSNLVGRRVAYAATIYPAGGATITLVPEDTVLTNGSGTAFARVRLVRGTRPDSVVVTATARRADGSLVPGMPVPFVVEFRP